MRGPSLLSLTGEERGVVWQGILELSRLEEEVLGHDQLQPSLEETFSSGMDEWWPVFVSRDCM
ncbi:MAG TPA: hypothetical protein PK393_00510 [Synergistaceae bacterium]|nr:hypothetical protein [Synergistaceae bacterium]HQF90446.1 hypothetical protein [Synergistaceae bacterium]HQH77439.1 hypothetical protein [Synergistaceae bacterium]HQK23989.1 hypothetical protein [Synergistaceae bacterium]